MYRCTECGNLFEEGEQATWEERHGLDSRPYGLKNTVKSGAVALFARAVMRKSTNAKNAAIGTQRMNCMMAGAKIACVKQ